MTALFVRDLFSIYGCFFAQDSQYYSPCPAQTHSRCVWLAKAVVLGTAASAECHKYFPLFRNGPGE